MRKALTISGIFIAIAGAAVFVTYKYQHPVCTTTQSSCPPWWHPLIAWPEGITVWVILLTLIVIGWQSLETRNAARAALVQANHMVSSDRAWLIIRPEMKDYIPSDYEKQPAIKWSVRNAGNTIAQLVSTACVYQLISVAYLKELPSEPDYSLPIELADFPLPPKDSIGFTTNLIEPPRSEAVDLLDHETVNTIQLGLLVLMAYGFVRYMDAYGNLRESRFCERYYWPKEGAQYLGFRPMFDAPRAYTQYT